MGGREPRAGGGSREAGLQVDARESRATSQVLRTENDGWLACRVTEHEMDHPMPADVPAPQVSFVDDPALVRAALERVAHDVVGVDVERADADQYFRRAALVQVGVAGHCVLLDGVVLDRLHELDAFLGPDRLAVLHAVENDIEPLLAKHVDADRLADTAIAAAMLGLPTGLGPLLTTVLGVELTGDKSAFQRADWAARPLSEGMADYAAGDVVHLPELWAELAERLEAADRRRWYDEELAWTLARAVEDNRDWTRVKGSGRLRPDQRAVLRSVWEERERLAREHDIAPNRLIHDDVLRDLAVDPPRTEPQLVRRSQRRRSLLRKHAAELLAAVERGVAAEPETKESAQRWTDTDRATYDALRERRAAIADDLGIQAGVLCPSRPLWTAVAGDPADGVELCALAELRAWQTEVLAEPLWDAYLTARRPAQDAIPHDAGIQQPDTADDDLDEDPAASATA
jgi:ribonuclease D